MAYSLLYVFEGFKNPGDGFSQAGARYFLHEAIRVVCEQNVNLRSTRDLPSLLDLSGPDMIVYAGAPWFWEGCTDSKKYAAAFALNQMARGYPKVALGVGSCFLSAHDLPAIDRILTAEGEVLRRFWSGFDLIVVRDALAWWILHRLGLKATLAPCPSIAVEAWFGLAAGADGLVILGEPLKKNFMYQYLGEHDEAFYRKSLQDLVLSGGTILEWIPKNRVHLASRSLTGICREIRAADCARFFTARVHAALVATGLGLRGSLMALDSRALSASLCGVRLVGPQADFFLSLEAALGRETPAPADVGSAIHQGLEAIL